MRPADPRDAGHGLGVFVQDLGFWFFAIAHCSDPRVWVVVSFVDLLRYDFSPAERGWRGGRVGG